MTMQRERLGDEARFELSLAAMSHERRNRPVGLVIAAAVALAVAIIFAGWGLSARSTARTDLVRTVSDKAYVDTMAQEWLYLHDIEQDPTQGRAGRAVPHLLSRMEDLAVRAGLPKPQPPRQVPRSHPGNVRVIEYHYGDDLRNPIAHPSLSKLLEWIRLVQEDELGMELIGLQLTQRPQQNDWRMTAMFRRWERAGR